MSQKLNELQAKRAELASEIRKLADRQSEWVAEDRAKWQEINATYDAAKTALDAEVAAVRLADEERATIANRLKDVAGYKDYQPTNHALIGRDGASLTDGPVNGRVFSPQNAQQHEQQLQMALQGWMRAPHNPSRVGPVTDQHRQAAQALGINLSSSEFYIPLANNYRQIQNTLTSQTGSSGGFTFGETFVGRLELAMKAYGGMFQVAEVIRTTSGEPMRWPTANDTSNTGRMLGESAAVTTLDPTFAQRLWYAYKFTSDEILVPFELLRDNAINLGEVIPDMLGTRLGRIQNTKYTTGQGAGLEPTGIVTSATAGVTSASSTSIAADELITLEHKVDPSRRNLPGVGYMFHDNTLSALRRLKDGVGRYLWQAGFNTGAPDTINNRPYTINQDMASSIATTNITMLFGQLNQYKIRQVGEVRLYRLVERFRENDQDAFLAFIAGDGNLLDAGDHPVVKLTQV